MTAALALPSVVGAQTPSATTPAPTPAPAPAPAQTHAKLKLSLRRVQSAGVLAGTRWVVRGTLSPYVAGQSASVRFYRRGHKILVKGAAIQRRGSVGRFEVGMRATQPGAITVQATHRATAALATAIAKPVRVEVLPLRATLGASGLAVRTLQRRLTRLGYVVGRRGLFDERTARAVLAFRKVTGMPRVYDAGESVFRALAAGHGSFHVHFPRHGRHVEADISLQVLALIDHGRAVRLYPTSTGSPVTPTVQGSFHVYSKTPGYNAKLMYYASYFIRGYAIHGYSSVPPYNASHGCLRVPIPDAVAIYDWVRYGTPVDVYQ